MDPRANFPIDGLCACCPTPRSPRLVDHQEREHDCDNEKRLRHRSPPSFWNPHARAYPPPPISYPPQPAGLAWLATPAVLPRVEIDQCQNPLSRGDDPVTTLLRNPPMNGGYAAALLTATATLIAIVGSAVPASAQYTCADLYNRTMASYQTYGTASPQYAQVYGQYMRCLAANPMHGPGQSMLSGTHNMPGTKAGTMSNQVMPERSSACAAEAVATMPPEHRLACDRSLR